MAGGSGGSNRPAPRLQPDRSADLFAIFTCCDCAQSSTARWRLRSP